MNKINIDRPKISEAEIGQFKDFATLLNNHVPGASPRPFYKNIWLNTFAGIGLTFVAIIAYISLTNNANSGPTKAGNTTPYINPQVPQWNIPYQTAIIQNRRDTVLYFSSGSYITILKNSFIDKNNKALTDSIEIRFREISSPAEIFLSGVPMEYDSAGVKSVFESAGMVEICGFYRNRPININPNCPIGVTLVSKTKDLGYNLYYLDTVSRNWVYKGKDVVKVENDYTFAAVPHAISPLEVSITSVKIAIANIQPIKPEPPQLASPTKWKFKLDLAKGEFPELEVFEKTLFEVDETYKPLNKKHTETTWEDITISKGNSPLSYFVKFKTTKDSCTYLARPVINPRDFAKAKARYDSSVVAYQGLLEKRRMYETKLNQMEATNAIQTKKRLKYAVKSDTAYHTENLIQRSFTIQNFGIWNCDKPRIVPNARKIYPTISLNDTIYEQPVYLADNKSISLSVIYPGNPIIFNERANNVLWMVTYDNKVAVFTANDFRNIAKNTFRYSFNMRLIKTPIRNADEFVKLYESGFNEL